MVWGTFFTIRTIQPFKKCPKKVPQSARLSAGGGLNAIWAMPEFRSVELPCVHKIENEVDDGGSDNNKQACKTCDATNLKTTD